MLASLQAMLIVAASTKAGEAAPRRSVSEPTAGKRPRAGSMPVQSSLPLSGKLDAIGKGFAAGSAAPRRRGGASDRALRAPYISRASREGARLRRGVGGVRRREAGARPTRRSTSSASPPRSRSSAPDTRCEKGKEFKAHDREEGAERIFDAAALPSRWSRGATSADFAGGLPIRGVVGARRPAPEAELRGDRRRHGDRHRAAHQHGRGSALRNAAERRRDAHRRRLRRKRRTRAASYRRRRSARRHTFEWARPPHARASVAGVVSTRCSAPRAESRGLETRDRARARSRARKRRTLCGGRPANSPGQKLAWRPTACASPSRARSATTSTSLPTLMTSSAPPAGGDEPRNRGDLTAAHEKSAAAARAAVTADNAAKWAAPSPASAFHRNRLHGYGARRRDPRRERAAQPEAQPAARAARSTGRAGRRPRPTCARGSANSPPPSRPTGNSGSGSRPACSLARRCKWWSSYGAQVDAARGPYFSPSRGGAPAPTSPEEVCTIPPGTCVRSIRPGVVAAVFADFVASTVLVRHDDVVREGARAAHRLGPRHGRGRGGRRAARAADDRSDRAEPHRRARPPPPLRRVDPGGRDGRDIGGWEQLLAVAKFGCPTVVDDGSVLGSKAGANGQELRAWEAARGTRVHGAFCETVN